jgi:predicted GNAT family acetyltransferase
VSHEPEIRVTDNRDEGRYEAHVDGKPAGRIYYRERPDSIVLVHTEVDEEFEGHGVGGRLVAGALDDIRSRGLSVTPVCRFADAYIRRHPEYADLVAA